MKLSTEEIVNCLKQGIKLRPVVWNNTELFKDGYCTLDGSCTFVQYTPKTVGVKVSPVSAGVVQVVKQFGDDWEIVE